MVTSSVLVSEYLRELQAEATASRKCLANVSERLFGWKPHEKSMAMGYLALLVAEVSKWIHLMVNNSDLDFANFQHFQPTTTAELVSHLDENLSLARNALQNATDQTLSDSFHLKSHGQLLFTSSKKESISSSLNHWVHHRGQLTVYLRLNDLPVPSIYGPSADDKSFGG